MGSVFWFFGVYLLQYFFIYFNCMDRGEERRLQDSCVVLIFHFTILRTKEISWFHTS